MTAAADLATSFNQEEIMRIESQEVHSENPTPKGTVIMLHGFGADYDDLVPLATATPAARNYNWIFPRGVYEVPIGPGWTGRAWWPLDLEKLATARDISVENPPLLPVVREALQKWIASLKIPPGDLVLGGFSQGGMLAADLALHFSEKIRGCLLLSTALVAKNQWAQLSSAKDVPFFQSHGEQDPVIDFKNAQRLESFLQEKKWKGKLVKFSGAHEIPPAVLMKMDEFLGGL